MTMLCYVTRPDAVVMEVEVEAKANGEDCLNQVRPAAGRPLGAGDRWGPEGGAPSFPHPTSPPLMAGEPPPFFPFIYLFSSLLPFFSLHVGCRGCSIPRSRPVCPQPPPFWGREAAASLLPPKFSPQGPGGPILTRPPRGFSLSPPGAAALPCHPFPAIFCGDGGRREPSVAAKPVGGT